MNDSQAHSHTQHTRRVVIAVDSFKGSIGAAEAAAAIAEGWSVVRPDDELVMMPMADGGEGTLAAFAASIPEAIRMPVVVRGPDGADTHAYWLLLPDDTAVVELASTSGIELLGEVRLPFEADTFGFGQAILAALESGASKVVLGIGSSASTDGGVGLLSALGARFLDTAGNPIAAGLAGLDSLASVDLRGLASLPSAGATVLSDVTNPLLGAAGAAAIFGPQKGLGGDAIDAADRALGTLASLLHADPTVPGAGAAGGSGMALLAWGAHLQPGAPQVAELIGLQEAIAGADLVITGEGSFDSQSARGKVPGFVASLARQEGVPVALVAGRVTADADVSAFSIVDSLSERAGSAERAMTQAADWLTACARAVAENAVGAVVD